MAKFSGVLGVVLGFENIDGVAEPIIKECDVYGEVISQSYRLSLGELGGDKLSIPSKFSFIVPPNLVSYFTEDSKGDYSLHLTYFGRKLKVETFEIIYPRMAITVGGLYNG